MTSAVEVLRGVFGQVWPTLPRADLVNPSVLFARYADRMEALQTDSTIPDDDLLDQVRKMWSDQEAKLGSIDTRAGQLMAAAGIAASLTTTAVNQKGIYPLIAGKNILIIAYLLALVYFTYCIVVTLRVHGERRRYKIGPDELLHQQPTSPNGVVTSYQRMLALEILRCLIRNYQTDNMQAETLYTAQRCFRNAILLLVVGGVSAVWT